MTLIDEPREATAASVPAPAAFRAIQVLDAIAAHHGAATLSQIAAAIPLPKSSTSNLLVTLELTGMVRRVATGWLLGFKAIEFGQAVLGSTDLVAEFRMAVNTLPTLRRDTVLLAALDGAEVLYLARHDGQQPIRLASDIGRRMPAVVTSLGKAMLAALPAQQLDELLDGLGPLPRPTKRSHRTVSELRRDLARVREHGYAVDDEQNTIGVTCLGVAIPGAARSCAVSTTLLSQRVTPEVRVQLVAELQTLASRLAPFAVD
jgi:DNA-binding IclR family transcriptional regulator